MVNLIGYVEGVEISFDFYPPDTYKGIIPKQIDGRYIVELRAIDEAGNTTGMTNVYILIDFDQLEFKVLSETYSSILEKEEYANEIIALFIGQDESLKYEYEVMDNGFTYKEVVIKWLYIKEK